MATKRKVQTEEYIAGVEYKDVELKNRIINTPKLWWEFCILLNMRYRVKNGGKLKTDRYPVGKVVHARALSGICFPNDIKEGDIIFQAGYSDKPILILQILDKYVPNGDWAFTGHGHEEIGFKAIGEHISWEEVVSHTGAKPIIKTKTKED